MTESSVVVNDFFLLLFLPLFLLSKLLSTLWLLRIDVSIAEAVGSTGKSLLIPTAHLTGFSLDSHGSEVPSLPSWIPPGKKKLSHFSLQEKLPWSPPSSAAVGTLLQKVCSN